MNQDFNLLTVIQIILKRKKLILSIIFFAAIASVIVSLLLPNYYEASSVFYPRNYNVTDRGMLFSYASNDREVTYFGGKHDVERLISIGQSNRLVEYAIEKYSLVEHYEIDTTKRLWGYKVKKEFRDNYSINKTDHGAVKIQFIDKDPKLTAKLVNDLVDKIGSTDKSMVQNNKLKIVDLLHEKITEKRTQLKELTDSIVKVEKKYDIQQITETSIDDKAIFKGSEPEGVQLYRLVYEQQQNLLAEINRTENIYDQYMVSAKEDIQPVYVIEEAFVPEKKSWPIRWLICVVTVAVSAFVSIIGALFVEKFNMLREELRDNDAYSS